ncbi:MAG TPA: hypothetical protein VGO04_23265 [Ensifer sp.]|jgi:tetratricopeptide (TPR) repeat protein|uniref:hypothetical protein n=1 Tax=Ensifer sp. TaxID=1872086 RepID=UPI002E0F951B|nr:hypothetical protein [Ensifer sp.]
MVSRRFQGVGRTIAVIALVLLVVGATTSVLTYRSQLTEVYRRFQTDRLLTTISKPENLSWKYASLVKVTARAAIKYDPWNDPLKVNVPYGPRGIYLYLLNAKAKNIPSGLRCNCTALSYSRAIVCDEDFIRRVGRYLQDPDVKVPSDPKDDIAQVEISLMQIKAMALLSWLIAHEIGHVVLGHTEDPRSDQWTLESMSSFTSVKSTPLALGSHAEIEADEYALRSMFSPVGRRQNETAFPFFMQTIGLLTYHVGYSLGKYIEYNQQGHPPFAARLFNAWAVYKRDYSLSPELDSDDRSIITTFKNIEWKTAARGLNPFCEEKTPEALFKYPILPGEDSEGAEIMGAIISAWTMRDSHRAVELLRQLKQTVKPAISRDLEQTFELISGALRPPLARQTVERLEAISSKGLVQDRDDGVSEFAQILATASLVSLGQGGKWDTPKSAELFLRFDAARANLQRVKHRSEISNLALGNSVVFMMLGGAVGSQEWRSIILDLANARSDSEIDDLNGYLMDLSFSLDKNRKVSSRDFDELYWNVLDTSYVLASAGNYRSLVASSRLRQAQYAARDHTIEANHVWALYYEAIALAAERDYDTPSLEELVIKIIKYLNKEIEDNPDGLPALSSKWSDEFQGRFLNILGWTLLRKGRYSEALDALSKAELITLMQNCFWLKYGEHCVDESHPLLVSVRDNLAEGYLASGKTKWAVTAAARANIQRNKLAKETGKGNDEVPLAVIASHYRILAASLLQMDDKEAAAKGRQILAALDSMLVRRLWPQIPSRAMFDIIIDGKTINLVQFMPHRPEWDKRADVLRAYEDERGKQQ